MDRYSEHRSCNRSPCTPASEQTKPVGTINHNAPELDKDGPNLDDDYVKDAVPVGASIFGPFNALTASNLKMLRKQQISKGIHKELAKIRDLRAYLRSLQLADPGFAPQSNDGIGAGASGIYENRVCEPTHLSMEAPVNRATTRKATAATVPNMGFITPQSLEEQAEQHRFVQTPTLKNPTMPNVMPKTSKPSLAISGPTVMDSAIAPAPVATGEEEKAVVLSWLSSTADANVISSANTDASTYESQAPKSICSEIPSDVHTTASVAYSRCKKRINLQVEHLRNWIKKGRAARKAERAVQRSSRSPSRVSHPGLLLGASIVSTTANEPAQITKLLADLETKCMARISAVEEACEFKVGELNAAFGARLADLEDEREMVASRLANAEKNIRILASEIEDLVDSEAITGVRQNQRVYSGHAKNATSTYQRRGVGPGQGEAFRI